MKKQIIVERDSSRLKAVQCARKFAGYYFEEGITYDFSSPGFHEQTEEMCDFLRHRFENMDIYINLPADKTLIREFDLPFTDKKKIKELVPHEMEPLLPYEIQDLVYDYKVFADYKERKSKIVSVSTPRNFITEYIQKINEQNIPLRGVYVPMEGIYYVSSLIEETDSIYLVVSANESRLLVVDGGVWKTSRVFPMGYDVLIRRVSAEWKKDEEESRHLLLTMPDEDESDFIKKNYKLPKDQANSIAEVIHNYGADLAMEVQRTLGDQVEKTYTVFLATDLGNPFILENLLSRRLSMPVYTFPYDRTPIQTTGREYFLSSASAMAISSTSVMNLYTRDLKKATSVKKSNFSLGPAITMAAGVFLFIASLTMDYFTHKQAADILRQRQKDVYKRYFGAEPNNNVSYLTQAEQKLAIEKSQSEIYRKFLNKPKLMDLLDALNTSTREIADLEVRKLAYDQDELKLDAETDGYKTLGQIKEKLEKIKLFKKVEIKRQETVPSKTGTSNRLRFSIVMTPGAGDAEEK